MCSLHKLFLLTLGASGVTPAAELLEHLRLDDGSGQTATDSSSYANHAIVLGPRWVQGKFGTGLSFDGDNDYLRIPFGTAISRIQGAVTVSVWVFRSGKPGYFGNIVSRQVGTGAEEHFWLGFFNDNVRWFVRTTDRRYSNTSIGPAIPYREWVHIAGTYDGSNVRLYINGAEQFSSPHVGTFAEDVTPVLAGAGSNASTETPSELFQGTLDEIRIYDYALTADQVQALASGTATEPPINSQPAVSLTSPASGAVFTAPASISVAATASQAGGSILKVEFFAGAVKLGEASTAPYSFQWSSVPAGDYSLTAVATGSLGGKATSAVVNVSVQPATSSNPSAPGLVGSWSFDEGAGTSAGDASGNSNHATLLNGATWTPGRSGTAVQLDGNNDFVRVPNSATIASPSSAITVMAWIRWSGGGGYFNPIVTRQAGTSAAEHYWLGLIAGQIRWFVNTSGAGYSNTSLGPPATSARWVHVAGSYDGASVKLYVDGVQQFSVSHTGTFAADSSAMAIGGGVNDTSGVASELFNGAIDHVRLFNRALSASEISAESSGAPPPPPTNPPPTVSLTSPTAGAVFTAPATISLAADASQSGGSIVKVEFFSGTAKIGESTTAPFTFQWSSVPAGDYSLAAVATGNFGGTATSAAVTVRVEAQAPPPTSGGLIGAWSFDEGAGTSAADASGNANSAMLLNGASWASGRIGSAVQLDGSNDFVRVPNSSTISSVSTALTVMAWIRWSGGGGYFNPVLTRQAGTGAAEHYWLGLIAGQIRWFVNTPSGYSNPNIGAPAQAGRWMHIAGVYDGSTVKLYVDGLQQFSVFHSGALLADTTPLIVGGGVNDASGSANELYSGAIDQVKVFSRALTASEIAAEYGAANGANQSPSVSITSPATGSVFDAGVNIAIAASASDADGAIGRVEFYSGAQKIGEAFNQPYSVNWASIPAGDYTLTARAVDNLGAATTSGAVAISVVTQSQRVLRLMPLGDSITHGYNVPGGYRNRLWTLVANAGRTLDFVGALNDGPTSLPDRDHEGHPGWRTIDVSPHVQNWVAAQRPTTVLLMIGTNDVFNNLDLATLPNRLSDIIDKILAGQPGVSVIVASIPPWTDPAINQRAQQYNAAIPGVVDAKASAGKKVYFANVYSALSSADLADGVHPTAAGYDKIADVWYKVLSSISAP